MQWGKYNLIDSPEKIKQVDDFLMDENSNPKFNLISYDTETNGLYLFRTVIVGFSFSTDAHSGFYFPLLIWEPDHASQKSRTKDKVKYEVYEHGRFKCFWSGDYYPEDVTPAQYKMPEFVPALVQRWFTKSQLIMWNAPFDINHTFINFGVDLKDNLVVDGGLIAHVANENESVGLKENAILYRNELGINPFAMKTQEKEELKGSVIRNGGNGVEVWRADLEPQSKYAIADTFLTYGLFEVILQKIANEQGQNYPKIEKWIFDDEVMPVCKEVVVDMKRRGVYIDVAHFQKLYEQNAIKLIELEDAWMQAIDPLLEGFDKGKSIDDAVSHQRLVKEIIAMEGLSIPQLFDKKSNKWKDSIAKGVVKKEYEKNPHWIWAYILGEDEIKYPPEKIKQIKQKLYEEVTEGKRYRFNMGSNDHLIWLFFTKLGEERRKFPKTEKSTIEDWTPSLDADTIKQHLFDKYSFVNILLKYKKIQKIQSTYVAPALEYHINGWMYMDMKQNGTTSGRFSCSGGYNLQTLPRVDDEKEALEKCDKCESKNVRIEALIEVMANRVCNDCGHVEHDIVRPSAIKKGFIAPPGYKIINADYSSLEPRCFAYMSEEDNIKQVYRDNLDLYSKVYIDIFDKEGQYSADPKAPNFLKKVNGKARTFIKPLVLGIPYGAGEAQVANLAGYFLTYLDEYNIRRQRPDMDKGKKLRKLYLDTYSKLQYYMLEKELEAIMNGYVDAKYGRRRHFEYAPIISQLLYKKLNLDSFNHSSDFTYVTKLVEKYEENGTMTPERLQGCRILESVYNFLYIPKKPMNKIMFSETNKDTGLKVTLTSEDLRVLCGSLQMRLFNDEPGFQEPVCEKGFWSYIRNLMKADLNNAKNHPIQALAGHITNMGMLSTTRLFKQAGIDGWVCNQVHDEITTYARVDQAEQAKAILQFGMENNMFTDPLKQEVVMIAEPVICDSLKEAK